MDGLIIQSQAPLYAVAISLGAALLIAASGQRPQKREAWTLLAATAKFMIVGSMLPDVLAGRVIECDLVELGSHLSLALRVDALGLYFALAASLLWIITSVYSIGYVRAEREKNQTRYFMSFAVALSSTIGVAFSANLFTMFVFYEALTLSTFALVAHKQTPEAMAGARRYLTYLLGASLLFLMPAIALTYHYAGTLDFAPGGILSGKASRLALTVMFALFILGTAKAALMPLHSWLPAAMVAPTPVSALLHAVAVVKTGVFVIIKIVVHVFGIELMRELGLGTALACYASFTILMASSLALMQDDLKARLAYSTISQLAYIVLGAALLTPQGLTAGMLHIAIHAFGKITLFFAAGAIYVASHKTLVSQMDGIGRRMPFTMGAFTIGALSMIGIPPLGGFISKWYLIGGAVEAGQGPVLVVLALSSILNAAYFLPMVYRAFFRPLPGGEAGGMGEAPWMMVGPLCATALGTVAMFFDPMVFMDLVRLAVAGLEGGI